MNKNANIHKYLRLDKYPTIWCAGCGNGQVLGALLRAIDTLKLDQDKVVVVSGIGCSSRASGYLDFNTMHTTHGRPLAFATGIKLANPDLHVIVLAGDGDTTAIGGNHLIHAARRNIGITTVIFNNGIYGMTGGQCSPMTGKGCKATTAPLGNLDTPFDICELARAAGATFVARGVTYAPVKLEAMMTKALEHNGFSVIDCITQCPTYYGRLNKMGKAVDMLEWQKEHTITLEKAQSLPPHTLKEKIITGIYVNKLRGEYTERYRKLHNQCGKDESRD
ncbi:MAG: 2-oxoacid:ferredoxin oxidoreductase subunit beta [Bacillota bacterium]|nr:2-oxoacid:ferredoxin oxidoreductase subunit beta [Bacillota bacterium]MDW7684622.1 2-oxoacid:ferredoxin oxidoreductase subunit beta [Bacillota bacterium]